MDCWLMMSSYEMIGKRKCLFQFPNQWNLLWKCPQTLKTGATHFYVGLIREKQACISFQPQHLFSGLLFLILSAAVYHFMLGFKFHLQLTCPFNLSISSCSLSLPSLLFYSHCVIWKFYLIKPSCVTNRLSSVPMEYHCLPSSNWKINHSP